MYVYYVCVCVVGRIKQCLCTNYSIASVKLSEISNLNPKSVIVNVFSNR